MTRARSLAVLGAVVAWHMLPAATWLPPVRRLTPGLRSPMSPGTVAITFDDGPHPDGTPAVLDQLDELGWQATFFLLGSATRAHGDLAREVVARGHSVAVHGDDHRHLLARGPLAVGRDLGRAKHTVEAATGAAVGWWRPPYGVLSGAGVVAAARLGLRPLLWSAWGRDWQADTTAEQIAATVLRGGVDGGVVLLHDSDATSAAGSWRHTVAALPRIADGLAARGLRVAPLPTSPASADIREPRSQHPARAGAGGRRAAC